jgi:hypothetical protein
MRMASKASKKKAAKKRPAKKTEGKRAAKKPAKKTAKKAPKKAAATRPARAREKDPKGGLTAAGRSGFARRDGSHLKPGVTKTLSEMTPQDMRRKGSWAVRFYGRKKLPPLVNGRGRPTRHALSAHAWASLFLERSQRRGASPPRANGCCNAIGGSSKRPDACKRKSGLKRCSQQPLQILVCRASRASASASSLGRRVQSSYCALASDWAGAPFSGPRIISRLRAVFRFAGRLSSPGASFAVGGSPNPSQAIGAPAIGVVEQPVPEAQQPASAVPATSRTMNLVSIVAPVRLP